MSDDSRNERPDLSKKKPGSSRWRHAARSNYLVSERDEQGLVTWVPPSAVGIDFICEKCGKVLGRFRMSTMPDDDREVFMLDLLDGTLPAEAGRPDGQDKAMLACRACGRLNLKKASKVEEALTAIWKPGLRRVIEHKV